MAEPLRFSQFAAATAAGLAGTLYRSVEGDDGHALLDADGPVLAGALASYVCDVLGDTGPASEDHGVMMVVAFNAPRDRIPELEDWYAQEHIRLLRQADGWLRAINCRVRSISGAPPWTHLAFHQLRDLSVMDSPERAVARSTEWRARLAKEPWFPAAGRWAYQRL